jgi:hypothetical protein
MSFGARKVMLEGSKCHAKILSTENLGLTVTGWEYPQLTRIFIISTMVIPRIESFVAALAALELKHR